MPAALPCPESSSTTPELPKSSPGLRGVRGLKSREWKVPELRAEVPQHAGPARGPVWSVLHRSSPFWCGPASVGHEEGCGDSQAPAGLRAVWIFPYSTETPAGPSFVPGTEPQAGTLGFCTGFKHLRELDFSQRPLRQPQPCTATCSVLGSFKQPGRSDGAPPLSPRAHRWGWPRWGRWSGGAGCPLLRPANLRALGLGLDGEVLTGTGR